MLEETIVAPPRQALPFIKPAVRYYCVSKKSWPILDSKLLHKMGQDSSIKLQLEQARLKKKSMSERPQHNTKSYYKTKTKYFLKGKKLKKEKMALIH